jgi:hypothetical protein
MENSNSRIDLHLQSLEWRALELFTSPAFRTQCFEIALHLLLSNGELPNSYPSCPQMECLEIALHPLPVKRKFEIVLHLLPLKGELCSSFMSLASQRRSFAIVSHLLPLNRKALNGFT